MPEDCNNCLSMSGDQTEIDEFINLLFQKDKHGEDVTKRYTTIDCKGMISKVKISKITEVIEVIKKEISDGNIIDRDA